MIRMPIQRIHAEWPLSMSALSLLLDDGGTPTGSISIRANVAYGDPQPEEWRRKVDGFEHRHDYTLEEAQHILPLADQMEWDPILYDAFGRFEYRAVSGLIRLWLTIPNDAFPGVATDLQKAEAQKALDELKAEVWPR